MEELKLLGPTVLKRKRHCIPVGIRYWLFFKRHILEKPQVRLLFEKELSREEFAALVKKHANPLKHGPSFCRRKCSRASNTRNTNDMLAVIYRYYAALLAPSSPIYAGESKTAGLGIFLRSNVVAKQGTALWEEHLFGTLFELSSEEEIEQLKAEGYPSLLEVPRKQHQKKFPPQHQQDTQPTDQVQVFAMCGPLSLANHSCQAALHFTLPRSMLPREDGREFHGLQAVYAQAIPDRGFRGKQGRELVVKYDSQSGARDAFKGGCRCSECVKNA